MKVRLVLAAVLIPLLAACVDDLAPAGPAQPAEDAATQAALVEDGRAIAETNCAACHAIGKTGESPNARAPVFRTLLGGYNADVLETELIIGMRVAHKPMPEFQFDPVAAGALIAYLRSVQTADPGQALAEQRCAKCHAIGRTGTSPYPGAQPFRHFGRRWSRGQLRDALRTGIIVEHDNADVRVPPMKLTDPEIDVLLDYLDSIATKENRAPGGR
jgi:mono/diheme cytochrome c family protein